MKILAIIGLMAFIGGGMRWNVKGVEREGEGAWYQLNAREKAKAAGDDREYL